ncbi:MULTISPECIES: hypothetical protein [unclassified Microbacterium]|uniref:hypothetical protein n=1 Tax=unclassified Microbacterium TaxID=2609290 RepID=UPI00386A6FAD
MSRIGGRNAGFAWFVGVVSAAVVVTLAIVAAPLFPAATGWFANAYREVQLTIDPDSVPPRPEPAPAEAEDPEVEQGGPPTECRDLYDQTLWTSLSASTGSEMVSSQDAPASSATALIDALQPSVAMTCAWTADEGSLSTTVAAVPTDAGAIAAAVLPEAGFSCDDSTGRVLCTRTDGDLIETIETGGGVWVSTSQQAWHPSSYASRVAEDVWAAQG